MFCVHVSREGGFHGFLRILKGVHDLKKIEANCSRESRREIQEEYEVLRNRKGRWNLKMIIWPVGCEREARENVGFESVGT